MWKKKKKSWVRQALSDNIRLRKCRQLCENTIPEPWQPTFCIYELRGLQIVTSSIYLHKTPFYSESDKRTFTGPAATAFPGAAHFLAGAEDMTIGLNQDGKLQCIARGKLSL